MLPTIRCSLAAVLTLLASTTASAQDKYESAHQAAKMLEKGERDAVLAYFDLCEKLWEMGKERLADWKALVRAGRTPDFGASLTY